MSINDQKSYEDQIKYLERQLSVLQKENTLANDLIKQMEENIATLQAELAIKNLINN